MMRQTHLLSAIRQYLRRIVLFIAIFFFPHMGYAIGTLAGIYQPEVNFGKNTDAINMEKVISTIAKASYYIEPTLAGSDILKNEILKHKMSILSKENFDLFSHGRPGELLLGGEWRDVEHIIKWFKQNNIDLSEKKQLNIYGCNFAKGVKGKKAVEDLERKLDIFVAASDDITGISGDWELESGSQYSLLVVKNYTYNLLDTDGDGVDDNSDIDDDNDGILDSLESGPSSVKKTGKWTKVSSSVWESIIGSNIKVRVTLGNYSGFWGAYAKYGYPGNTANFDNTCTNFTSPNSLRGTDGLQIVTAYGAGQSSGSFTVEYFDATTGNSIVVENPIMHWAGVGGRDSNSYNVNTSTWTLQGGLTHTKLSGSSGSTKDFAVTSTTVTNGSLTNYAGAGKMDDCAGGEASGSTQINGNVSSFTYDIVQYNSSGSVSSSSGDGIDFIFEVPVRVDQDSDGDGVVDRLDLDSDNDGIPDNVEAQTTADYIAPDEAVDANGVDTAYANGLTPVDSEGDGTPDVLDTDSDGDGKLDKDESGLALTGADANNDGIDDGVNASYDDTNGDVNDPATFLKEADNVTTDVDYRSVQAADDVLVVVTVSDENASVGDEVTFTLTYTNIGANDTTGSAIEYKMPTGLENPTTAVSQGSYSYGWWDVGALASGDSATITLVGTIGDGLQGGRLTAEVPQFYPNEADPSKVGDVYKASVAVASIVAEGSCTSGYDWDNSGWIDGELAKTLTLSNGMTADVAVTAGTAGTFTAYGTDSPYVDNSSSALQAFGGISDLGILFDPDADTGTSPVTITLTFSEPVYNASFLMTDIDNSMPGGAKDRTDRVTVTSDAGDPTLTALGVTAPTVTVSDNVAEATLDREGANNNQGTVRVVIPDGATKDV